MMTNRLQSLGRFPFSKSVVGQDIALHAVPADRASTYLVSAFPAHPTSFSPNLGYKPSINK